MTFLKSISTEVAAQKIRRFCAYQERCHQEVKEKLYSMGLYKSKVETLISQMIEEDYLNEERFALQFAGGKFRMKDWGRIKIKYELKKKGISEYCIKKAISSIDPEAYEKKLEKLCEKKRQSLADEKNQLIKNQKIKNYLLQKGFEGPMIDELLKRGDRN